MLHFRYDTLLSQNERLKKQINAMNYKMKEKQKEVCMFKFSYICHCTIKYTYKIISEERDIFFSRNMSYFCNVSNIIIYVKLNEFCIACHIYASHNLICNSRICDISYCKYISHM